MQSVGAVLCRAIECTLDEMLPSIFQVGAELAKVDAMEIDEGSDGNKGNDNEADQQETFVYSFEIEASKVRAQNAADSVLQDGCANESCCSSSFG